MTTTVQLQVDMRWTCAALLILFLCPVVLTASGQAVFGECIYSDLGDCEGWSPDFLNSNAIHAGVVAISSDGEIVATRSPTPRIPRFVGIRQGSDWRIVANQSRVNDLLFLSDGRIVSAGGFPADDLIPKIRLWEDASWTLLDTDLTGVVTGLATLPTGGFVVGGGLVTVPRFEPVVYHGVGIRLWTGSEWTSVIDDGYVRLLSTGPDGDIVANMKFNGGSRWQVIHFTGTGEEMAILGEIYTTGLAMHASGSIFLSQTTGNVLRWDGVEWIDEGFFADHLVGAGGSVAAVEVTDQGMSVHRYESSGWVVQTLEDVVGTVTDVAIQPGGSTVVLAGLLSVSGENGPFEGVLRVDASGAEQLGDSMARLGLDPTDASVSEIVLDAQDDVIVAGAFTHAGGVPVNNIARFDGSTWHELGGGTDERIFTLFLDSSRDLLAGGPFNSAGGVASRGVARWSNGTWHDETLEEALRSHESVWFSQFLRTSTARLYGVGGYSNKVGTGWERKTVRTGFLAERVAGEWVVVAEANDYVNTIAEAPDGSLVVGGRFTSVNGLPADLVARFDESGFLPIDGFQHADPGGVVAKLVQYEGAVYAVGRFDHSGSEPTSGIARLTGTTWQRLGAGLSDDAHDAVVGLDGLLYILGRFEWADQTHARGLGVWNGMEWVQRESTGDLMTTGAIAVDESGALYAGGDVPYGNGFNVWRPVAKSDEGDDTPSPEFETAGIFPNPTSSILNVHLSEPSSGHIWLSDMLGRRIRSWDFHNGYRQLDVADLPAGVYMVTVSTDKNVESYSVIIVH